MAFSKIRPRGDTKSKWEAANPVLLEREIGVEWENTIGVGEVNIKFGDGVKHWNELDYAVVSDIKKKIISSFAEVTAENPALEEGSTLDLLWAVTKKKFEYLNTQINGIKTIIGAFSNITIESGGVDQAAADITNAIQLLNSGKLSTADIYNGLDSTNALLALSALQGHDLNSKIEKLNGDLASYKSYEFSDSSFNTATITDMVEQYWPNISGNTYGLVRYSNNSSIWIGTYIKYGNDDGAITINGISAYSPFQRGVLIKTVWKWDSTVANSDLAPTAMTTTRTENPYVSATSFNRIVAKKIGPNLLWVLFNANVDLTPFPNGGNDFIEIGKVNGISGVPFGTLFDIPAQNGSGTILLDFSDNGVFKIVNQSGKPVSGFVRTSFVAVVDFA